MSEFYDFAAFKKFISESLTTVKEQKEVTPVKSLKEIIANTLSEERDPNDTQTRSLLPMLEDEKELQTIHHQAELHVLAPGAKQATHHVIGTQTFTRKADESAKDFKERAFNKGPLEGHSSFDHLANDATQHTAYSPYDSFDELAQEEGTHHASGEPRWMHAGSSGEQDHMIDNESDHALNTSVHHYLKVGHRKTDQ